jgi:hypothetical protein
MQDLVGANYAAEFPFRRCGRGHQSCTLKKGHKHPRHTVTDDASVTDGTKTSFRGSTSTSSPRDVPAHLLTERNRYIEDIRRWERAASPIFASPCQAPETQKGKEASQDFLQATLLKLHSSFNSVLLRRTFYPPETAYDVYLPEFKTQVELCELVAPFIISPPYKKSSSVYRFDLGIISPLSQIAALCRHSETRGRALGLMETYRGSKEGVWDCAGAIAIGSFFRDVVGLMRRGG